MPSHGLQRFILLASLFICLADAGPTVAQTFSWSNAGGGSFHTGGNWSPAGPPGAGHTALFSLGGSYVVSFGSPVTNAIATVGAGNVQWALGGVTYTITNSGNINAGSGSLTVTNGNVNSNTLNIGNGISQTGNLIVSTGATWNSSQGFTLGVGGSTGTSNLTVQNGGDLITNSTNTVGNSTSGASQFTLMGTGSTWTHNNPLTITLAGSNGGTGSISILNGGSGTSQGSVVFGSAGGTGNLLVRGSSSTLSLTGAAALTVGTSGTGVASIEDGAIVNVGSAGIGTLAGGTGTITVKSLGAQLNVAGLMDLGGTVGAIGNSGNLHVQTGGTVTIGNTIRLWNAGTINLAGGLLSTPAIAFNGGNIHWTSGQLHFTTSQNLSSDLATTLFGNPNTLGAGRTLSVSSGQSLTVNTPLLLQGQLSGGNISNSSTLVVSSGSVAATNTFVNNVGRLVLVEGLGTVQGSTSFLNQGTIQMAGPATSLSGAALANSGLLTGTGTVTNSLNNATTGTVRVTGSERLVFNHATNNNSGNLELVGGTLEFTQTLTNNASGSISGRGALHTSTQNPGGLGIVNHGVMLFSAGLMDVRGDVQNQAGASIITGGAGITTFYDDVVHNGAEIRTNAGARTVFFGAQSGAGAFTGLGTVEYNGDARPGNSPALVYYEGDVEFSFTSRLHIELGGQFPGSGYDQLSVFGNVYLAGRLIVSLDHFTPDFGDVFRIIDNRGVNPVMGTFQGLPEGSTFLVNGVEMQITYMGGTGNDVELTLTAIPEPGTFLLLGASGLAYGLWRRYRTNAAALAEAHDALAG